jgi:glycosyltransferase involved in cell wall biosynthesis
MNILVFSPYYPPHTGGLETHSDEFNKHLARNGVDVLVFTPNIPYTEDIEELKYDRVKIIRYPAFEIIANYPIPKFWHPTFWKLFGSLFRIKFDIVISRTRFFLSSLLALIYAKLTRTRWIHIEHGSDFVKISSSFKSAIAKLYDHTFGRIIFCSSDMNISISRAVQNFVAKFDSRKSPVIYRGIDFESIDAITPDETIREQYPRKIIISTAARLYKWKGIEHSIEAIRNLPEEIQTKIIFLIIGDGEDYERLKKLSQNLPIAMLGNLPRERVIALLKASDIYIHSSMPGGGLSTSLLEAMYCHCAVIATKNEGADEVIIHQKNGFLLADTHPITTKDALIKIISNPVNRKQYAETAYNTINQKFSWKISERKYLDIFSKQS